MSKHQDVITEVLYEASMESGHDEEMGSVDEIGWYGLFVGGLEGDYINSLAENLYVDLTEDDRETLKNMKGAILMTDSQGFVYSEVFDSKVELKQRWAEVVSDYEEYYGDDEDV